MCGWRSTLRKRRGLESVSFPTWCNGKHGGLLTRRYGFESRRRSFSNRGGVGSVGAQETVGKLIDDSEMRDAVHVAVEPCVAQEDLDPGDHVGLLAWGYGRTENSVGIV